MNLKVPLTISVCNVKDILVLTHLQRVIVFSGRPLKLYLPLEMNTLILNGLNLMSDADYHMKVERKHQEEARNCIVLSAMS